MILNRFLIHIMTKCSLLKAAYREKEYPNAFKNYTIWASVLRDQVMRSGKTPGPRKDKYEFCYTAFEPCATSELKGVYMCVRCVSVCVCICMACMRGMCLNMPVWSSFTHCWVTVGVEVVEEAHAVLWWSCVHWELQELLHVQRGWDHCGGPEEGRDHPWTVHAA